MGNTVLAAVEASRHKAEPARMPAMKPHGPAAIPAVPNFFGAAGNMAIQRAAAGPLGGTHDMSSMLGGAMSSGGCSCGGTCEECKKKPVQRKAEGHEAAPSHGFHGALHRSGPGAPLASPTRGLMESRFGGTFDNVRIHDDGAAADAARSIQAHAFTMGSDIYFGQGRYQPHSTAGEKLLAHELTHVLQQRRGAVPPGLKSLTAKAHEDVFEREAEQAEAHVGGEEHGAPAPLPASLRHSHGHSEFSTGKSLQRKPDSGYASPDLAPRSQKESREPVSFDQTIQRKCACGGTCAKCSGKEEELKTPVVQRKAEPAEHTSSRDQTIQRKCACGGTCAKCSGKEEELKTPVVQRKAEAAPEPARERTAASRENKPSKESKEKVGRKEAQRHERTAARQPGAGEKRARGVRPGRPGRGAVPGIQRSPSGPSARAASGARHDTLEREADAAANAVTRGRQVASEKLSQAEPQSIQAVDWEWCVPYLDPDCTASSTADVVASEASEIADDVMQAAQRFADAVGGVLEYLDNLLTITIAPKHVCDPHTLQLSLPEIGTDLPFLQGAVPLGEDVELYGEVGVHLGVIPEIGLHIGPCETHEIKIAIHPISMSGEVSGGFDVTLGASIGGELRAGIYGEVGVEIVWPDPPVEIKIPVVNLQAGLAGFIRAMAGDHVSYDFHEYAGITGFDFDMQRTDQMGFAADLGLAGYGALTVLGFNLCTLYFPLYETHKETGLNFGLGLGLSASSSSLSLSVDAEAEGFDPKGWSDLGIDFQRDMFKQDCPLCDFLKALGLMPSNFGGTWKGHPKPAWKDGPLHGVYPRDPLIASEAKCRGACGPDCETCQHEAEHYECEATPGGHIWWVYPNYEVCNSYIACRNHDACYDWCTDKTGFKGLGIYISPCHRWCDLECICNYDLPQCVGWISGKPPYDSQMVFSDAPKKKTGCQMPCPHKVAHKKEGGDDWLVCLPTLELFPRKSVAAPPLDEKTGKHTIWRKDVWIPYVGLATLEIYASGHLHGELGAGLGPGTIRNVCFNVDPHAGTYKARGELRIPAHFLASLTAGAELGADAKWFLIVKVASAKGTLEATARLAGKATLILSGQVDLSCRGGKPTMESDLDFPGCVSLEFELNAGFDIEALGFSVFSRKWTLIDAMWDKCWGEDVTVKHTGKDPKIDLRDKTISLTDLLEWLLSDKAEHTEPPSKQRQIKEKPLTTATAKTVPELAPQLDQTIPIPGTVTLNSGASNTVGRAMMTRFLTFEHSPGSDDTSKAQKNIYGFRKLPTLRAFGGSGFKGDQVYIKGHLLNAKLGGLAEDENLFPITGQANKDHNVKVEEKVKDLVKDQQLVAMYGVRVTGGNNPQGIDVFGDGTCTYEFLDAGFDCTFGKYTLFTDNTVELFDVKDEPIDSTFDRAGFIAGVKAKNCPEK